MTDKTPSPVPAPAPEAQDGPDAPEARDGRGGESVPEARGGPEPTEGAAGRPSPIPVSPAVHKRLTSGLGGFSLAIGACLALVAVIYLITPRSDNEVLPTVDYSSQQWALRNDAPYTSYAPEGLPVGWRPTSSRLHGLDGGGKAPVAWHLGFVTPTDEYAALEQSNEKASEYVPRMTNNKNSLGTQQIGGVSWAKYYRKDKKANSLARTLPDGVSLVVTGTASYDELAVLVAALKPQPKKAAPLSPSATPGS
ncbi:MULTISPECIES: DUF4245 domain-containing protein [Thermomonosporaceae]|uniref:DUF4245 domain-containing protein n=1 Tax=Thermomonosporaceae TaxID=2012 RepID=UPI00255AF420|nr:MULTISPECIES: DUF4245 domain-containing protein [Thermomonosporaceae]MDL4772250.1 DUF4245 domain-containing protein [Actinomadura xylanilytica]